VCCGATLPLAGGGCRAGSARCGRRHGPECTPAPHRHTGAPKMRPAAAARTADPYPLRLAAGRALSPARRVQPGSQTPTRTGGLPRRARSHGSSGPGVVRVGARVLVHGGRPDPWLAIRQGSVPVHSESTEHPSLVAVRSGPGTLAVGLPRPAQLAASPAPASSRVRARARGGAAAYLSLAASRGGRLPGPGTDSSCQSARGWCLVKVRRERAWYWTGHGHRVAARRLPSLSSCTGSGGWALQVGRLKFPTRRRRDVTTVAALRRPPTCQEPRVPSRDYAGIF
jgi:hypothetical protein